MMWNDQQVGDDLVPAALNLVAAVHDRDPHAVAAALDDARLLPGLCVVLAALVPQDRTVTELLSWTHTAADCEALIARGIPPHVAQILVGRVHEIL